MSTDDDNGNHECQGAVTYCCVSAEHCSGGHFLPDFAGMVLGTALCYALGTAWFVYLMDCPFWYALTVCVFPFIPGDLVKMVAAHLLGKTLRVSLRQAHLL